MIIGWPKEIKKKGEISCALSLNLGLNHATHVKIPIIYDAEYFVLDNHQIRYFFFFTLLEFFFLLLLHLLSRQNVTYGDPFPRVLHHNDGISCSQNKRAYVILAKESAASFAFLPKIAF